MRLVAVPVLAGLLVLGTIVTMQFPPSSSRPQVAAPDETVDVDQEAEKPTVSEQGPPADYSKLSIDLVEGRKISFEDWVPEVDLPDTAELAAPAESGTVLARWCGDTECAGYLIRPDGTAYRLADLNPQAAEAVAEYGLDGAMLAPHGGQLGIRTDGGYEIHDLESGGVERLEPGPTGSYWAPMTVTSSPMTFAQVVDGDVAKYVRFWSPQPLGDWRRLGAPSVFTPPSTFDLEISGDRFVEPVGEIGGERSSWPRLTDSGVGLATLHDLISMQAAGNDVSDFEQRDGGGPADFSEYLMPDETLAGPWGVPVLSRFPEPEFMNADLGLKHVFSVAGDAQHPVAILVPDGNGYLRIDLPDGSEGETWSYLGPTGPSSVAVARRVAGSDVAEVVQLTSEAEQVVLHTLPSGAEILTPGAVRHP